MIGIPTHLTDSQLIDALEGCARGERTATSVLVAHLAEMDARQLHLGLGFSSLFAYCTGVLRLSESATYKRIEVARAARRCPAILGMLADGSLSLSTALLVAPHLTGANQEELLASAAGLGKRDVAPLLARLFPRPDVVALVRKLPTRAAAGTDAPRPLQDPVSSDTPAGPLSRPHTPSLATSALLPSGSSRPPCPVSTPLAADRYQIRFTASGATWKKLRAAQDLLRHSIPSGDPAEIFDRALTLLLEDLARKKCAAVRRPVERARPTATRSRHLPARVRRAVWVRDQGRCAFVAAAGRRCQETAFVEFHHVEPYGAQGEATVENIQLRCRAHNTYESVLFYGSAKASEWSRSKGHSNRDAWLERAGLNSPRGESGRH